MRKSSVSILAIGVSALFAATSIVPAQAAMPVPQQQVVKASDVTMVRSKKKRILRHNRGWRGNKGWRNRAGVRAHQNRGWRGHRGHRYHTWRGYRGYSYYRPGYRYYSGFWYPAVAFGVVVAPRVVVGGRQMSHVRWCQMRYRSYRASDNTYQPDDGPRRQCVSP